MRTATSTCELNGAARYENTAPSSDLDATRYVRSGDGHIAYQILGEGTTDILLVNESVLPIEALHDNAHTAAYLRRLMGWGRVIMFDRRGVGLSDPVTFDASPSLDHWVADAVAVLDAANSSTAAVLSSGPSAGLIALKLAAEFPARVSCLSLYDAIARFRWAPDYPCGATEAEDRTIEDRLENDWRTHRLTDRRGRFAATALQHPSFAEWAMTWFRRGAGPSTVVAQINVLRSADVRAALPGVLCPTLIVNHSGVGDGPYLADNIRDARYVELADPCHLLFSPAIEAVMAATSELVNGNPVEPAAERVLTTVLFTDIVDSTARVAALGDRRWGVELDLHDDVALRQILRFGGRRVKTLGDGCLATFDAPTRAVQCAHAIQHEAQLRDVAVRAGVHTGEVEMRGDDVLGLTVHVAQRICALATADQVVVSQQVVDLVVGSELRFDDFGQHVLRGLATRPFALSTSAGSPTTRRRNVDGLLADLAPREREVLVAVSSGASNADVAEALFISEATVKAHVSHLFVKLDCTNRVQLAILAHNAGLAGR
jgi:class 3 adenylate cyclase